MQLTGIIVNGNTHAHILTLSDQFSNRFMLSDGRQVIIERICYWIYVVVTSVTYEYIDALNILHIYIELHSVIQSYRINTQTPKHQQNLLFILLLFVVVVVVVWRCIVRYSLSIYSFIHYS